MHLFTTGTHPHGHWQLQEMLGKIICMTVSVCLIYLSSSSSVELCIISWIVHHHLPYLPITLQSVERVLVLINLFRTCTTTALETVTWPASCYCCTSVCMNTTISRPRMKAWDGNVSQIQCLVQCEKLRLISSTDFYRILSLVPKEERALTWWLLHIQGTTHKTKGEDVRKVMTRP